MSKIASTTFPDRDTLTGGGSEIRVASTFPINTPNLAPNLNLSREEISRETWELMDPIKKEGERRPRREKEIGRVESCIYRDWQKGGR